MKADYRTSARRPLAASARAVMHYARGTDVSREEPAMKSKPRLKRRAAVCVLGLVMAASAWPKGGLDAPTLRQYGGRYATDCANPAAPSLRVAAEALTVEQNGLRLTGRAPTRPSAAALGDHASAKDFRLAMIGAVRGGSQLRFMVHADPAGPYIVLDGDAKVTAALGEGLLATRYRRCDARAVPAPARGVPTLPALVADPAFRRAYLHALGSKASQPRWLARLEGPAAPTRAQLFGGTPYVVVALCKARDCYDHSAVFLYSAAQRRVFGLIRQRGVKTLVGAPGPSLAASLERLWRSEWRQN